MPTIRIDDEVYAWLQSQARPFEDTPNSVLRRIADLDDAAKSITSSRRRVDSMRVRGEKTSQKAFRKPILSILKKHGGEAHRMTVLKELEKAMDDQLTEFDKSDIPSGTIRWQKSAEWEVRVMREKGFLKPVSETLSGIWALTEVGFGAASRG
jgi:hypothetical protein